MSGPINIIDVLTHAIKARPVAAVQVHTVRV